MIDAFRGPVAWAELAVGTPARLGICVACQAVVAVVIASQLPWTMWVGVAFFAFAFPATSLFVLRAVLMELRKTVDATATAV